MKDVPDLIQTTYGIDVRDLNDPENAVLAIMGYLIEALHQLKQSAANNGCTQIHSETYVDYLPYIYTGRTEKIRDCSARPWELGYVTRIKEYMNYVMVFTR